MSNPKKLDLSFEELCNVAKALNENTLANKTRSKEEKISTDNFIKKNFGINRKDFSFTIKETEIKYNSRTFLYDIPGVNSSTTKVNKDRVTKNSKVYNETTEGILVSKQQSIQKYTYELPQELKEIISLSSELKEMLNWYKKQTNTNIIDIPEINLNSEALKGEVVTRSYKMYKSVADEFKSFAANRRESIKDLISLALHEFVDRYKK